MTLPLPWAVTLLVASYLAGFIATAMGVAASIRISNRGQWDDLGDDRVLTFAVASIWPIAAPFGLFALLSWGTYKWVESGSQRIADWWLRRKAASKPSEPKHPYRDEAGQ